MLDQTVRTVGLVRFSLVAACVLSTASVRAVEIRPISLNRDSNVVGEKSGGLQEETERAKPNKKNQRRRRAESDRMLNIGFAHDPGAGNYDGVVGTSMDTWNLVSMGTTAKDFMRYSDSSSSTTRIRITRHDGAWGITGHLGIFRGYIYDNCQCKDLEATILDLEPGRYRAYIYAHGDAPNQNANIELLVSGESLGHRATTNDGTDRYRSLEMTEGVHYVTFKFKVQSGEEVKFVSHRDGSSYSMFNAIQLVPLEESRK